MIDPFKVYDPRKTKIEPFYTCKIEWRQRIENWKHDFIQNQVNYNYDDLEDFFYSAFSLNDYKSHQEVFNLIDNQASSVLEFHRNIGLALELHIKGKYKQAVPFINKAIQYKHNENRLQFYAYQLRKNNKLLFDLQKIKSNKKKIEFLNSKYFEISGNILYSCDLLGTKLLLKTLKRKSNSEELKRLSQIVYKIYHKTKNFKNNMSLFDKNIIKNNAKELFHCINTLKEKELNKINFIHWKIISKIIALSENVQQYYSIRELSKEILLKNLYMYKNKNNVFSLYGVRAQLENNINPEYNNIINKENYDIALAYAKLYENNRTGFYKEIKKYETQKDTTYKEIIKNKRVAVIGPNEPYDNPGEEIDSFDVVIRLNIIDFSKYEPRKFGTKKNVTSYVRDVLVKNFSKILSNLKTDQYIYFNSYTNDPIKELTTDIPNIRQTIDFSNRRNTIFYSGYATHIQRVILDTIRFQPAEIKIFNTNMWLNIQKNNFYHYQHSYSSMQLILHDIFSNFIFMKKLYENNIITGDHLICNILSLSTEDYLKEISLLYQKNK